MPHDVPARLSVNSTSMTDPDRLDLPATTEEPAARPAHPVTKRRIPDVWIAIAFLAPALVALVAFRLIPAGYSIVESFRAGGSWVGLSNYRFMFETDAVVDSLVNTLLFNLWINPLQIAVALALALLLYERPYLAGAWRMLVFMPAAVPLSVSTIVWGVGFRPDDGIVNAVLVAIGLPPQPWLTSPDQALVAIAILASWAGVGYWMLFLVAGLQDVPRSYLEAARLDGAGFWTSFLHIQLPLLKRPLAFVLVADTVANFLLFPPIQILTRGGPQGSTNLLIYEIYRNAFTFADYGLAYAQMVLLIGVMTVIVAIQFRLLRSQDR